MIQKLTKFAVDSNVRQYQDGVNDKTLGEPVPDLSINGVQQSLHYESTRVECAHDYQAIEDTSDSALTGQALGRPLESDEDYAPAGEIRNNPTVLTKVVQQ